MSHNKKESAAFKWPQAGDFRSSIRLEFSAYVSALILIIMCVSGFFITSRYVKTVTQNVVNNLLLQARAYTGQASKLLLSSEEPDALLLNNICRKFVQNNPDIYWVGITGADKKFVAHTDLRQVLAQQNLYLVQGNSQEYQLLPGETMSHQGDSIYITVSITENEHEIGAIALASGDRQINEARMAAIITVGSITALMILIGLPLTMVVLNRKLAPIRLITQSLQAVDPADFKIAPNVNSKNEFGYLAETLKVMGSKIKLANQETIERERMTRELEIAREIQRNILPTHYPKTLNFEYGGMYLSAREIGGDYFDFIDFGNGQSGFLVADVSGKSLPGMLVMLLTRDIVRKYSQTISDPAELLVFVNREILQNIKKGMFVTMFIAVIDAANSSVSFASAGHNPLIHVDSRSGRTEMVKTKGFPLGMVESRQFESRIELAHKKLNQGDWLIQYTDGINEGQNSQKEEFGMPRFISQIEKHVNSSPLELTNSIIESHKKFVGEAPQYDDMTLLAMKWSRAQVGHNHMESPVLNEQG